MSRRVPAPWAGQGRVRGDRLQWGTSTRMDLGWQEWLSALDADARSTAVKILSKRASTPCHSVRRIAIVLARGG
jgi:hypothetical protein